MVRNTRRQQHRTFGQAYRHLDKAQRDLFILYDRYHESHPDHGAYLKLMIESMMITQSYMKDFAIKTWGRFPKHIDDWAA